MVFEDRLWPDCDGRDLWPAVQTYVDSERRYGGAADAQKASGKEDAERPRGADLWKRLPIRFSESYCRAEPHDDG